jgi:hypothetical protein
MMLTRRGRLTGWLAVVMGVALVAPVAGAGAARAELLAMEGRRGTLTLAPGSSGAVTVNCQNGMFAISGGFTAGVADDVIIDTSRPSSTSNGWFVNARNMLSTTQTVEVLALCASITGRTFVSRTAVVAPNTSPEVTVACPAGTSNTGGGFRIDSVPRFPVTSSRPATAGQGWSMTAFNVTGVTRAVSVYAVCAVFAGRQVVSQGAILEPGTSLTLAADCGNKLVVGGGWGHGGGTRWLVDRAVVTTIRVFTGHYVNNTPTVRFGVITYAVCATAPTR